MSDPETYVPEARWEGVGGSRMECGTIDGNCVVIRKRPLDLSPPVATRDLQMWVNGTYAGRDTVVVNGPGARDPEPSTLERLYLDSSETEDPTTL